MAGRVTGQAAKLLKTYELTRSRLDQSVEQLSSGSRIDQPGDHPVDFERVARLRLDQSQSVARSQAVQSKITWYQSRVAFLTDIRETLSNMSQLSLKANSGGLNAADRQVLDGTFQSLKKYISDTIDGSSGAASPVGAFRGTPLLLGYSPPVDAETDLSDIDRLNLYTGTGLQGFHSLPLIPQVPVGDPPSGPVTAKLTGTAASGSTTEVILDANAFTEDETYAGLTLSVTGGTGSGQTAQIASYNGETRTATFQTALGVALDATSTYEITAGQSNRTIHAMGKVTSLTFASNIWGADNHRDPSTEDLTKFEALTIAEKNYRSANSIPDTDLIPKTVAENNARAALNIFDPTQGHIREEEQAEKMFGQLENAVKRISELISSEGAKVSYLQKQYSLEQEAQLAENAGIEQFKNIDFAATQSAYTETSLDLERVLSLVGRIEDARASLNSLLSSGGRRS